MLAFILAIAVGLASVFFFLSAFFAPKLHRKDDFLWSGVGFFYALVLWLCATRITGGVLLGQGAAVVLILSFAWQTIKLRAVLANPEAISPNTTFSLLDWIGGSLSRPKAAVKPAKTSSKVSTPQPETPAPVPETVVEPAKTFIPETEAAIADQTEELIADVEESSSKPSADQKEESVEQVQEIVATVPSEIAEQVTATASKTEIAPEEIIPIIEKSSVVPESKKPGFFSGLFSKKSAPPKVSIPQETNTNLIATSDAVEIEEETEDWDEIEEVAQPELIVGSVTVEIVETITPQEAEHPTEPTENEFDDLLENDPVKETEEIVRSDVNSENETTESEAAIVTSITGLSDMLETYDENLDEFDPYIDGQESTTALELNPKKLDLSVSKENREDSSSEVSSDLNQEIPSSEVRSDLN